MSQRVGTLKNDELWLRCPDCGDSQRSLDKGHLSVNIKKAVFYCVRCGYSGTLTTKQLLDLATRYDFSTQEHTPALEPRELLPEAATNRFSALRRWHYDDQDGNRWDVFDIRDPHHNERVGQYFRRDGTSLILGETGLGWVGDTALTSSSERPLRLVEGPYDVLGPGDVCCYGFLRSQALKLLRGHYVVLCPDGDAWTDPMLREKMMKLMRWCFQDRRAPAVVGLEMIPDGLDPDECHPTDRLYVPRDQILQRMSIRRITL